MAGIKEQLQGQLRNDGSDHINISAHGETDLGKVISPDWRKKFYVPHIGDFISARAFANWMVSGGDEELRHSSNFYKTRVPVEDFRKLLVFAKYYQMCAMRTVIVANKGMLDLPWVMYKRHISGVCEFDRWTHYPAIIKPMVQDIVEDASGRFDWSNGYCEVLDRVNHYLQRITGNLFIPFERLDELSRAAAASEASKEQSDKVTEDSLAEQEPTPQNDTIVEQVA